VKEYRQHKYEVPKGATEIILVRHGESRAATADNPFPLVEGQGDPELALQGRQQAVAIGERLKHFPIGAVYVTSLQRTVETAAPLCAHLEMEHRVVPDLREVHLGDWEGGKFRVMVHENHPLYLKMQEEQRWDVIPGAESRRSLEERIDRGLHRIAQAHPNELVVAVLHGGVIGHIMAEATGSTPFAFNGCDNGSISKIVMVDGKIVVRGFNDVSHLGNAEVLASLPT
jgi:probable phosphoglycerate mutase